MSVKGILRIQQVADTEQFKVFRPMPAVEPARVVPHRALPQLPRRRAHPPRRLHPLEQHASLKEVVCDITRKPCIAITQQAKQPGLIWKTPAQFDCSVAKVQWNDRINLGHLQQLRAPSQGPHPLSRRRHPRLPPAAVNIIRAHHGASGSSGMTDSCYRVTSAESSGAMDVI